MTKIACPHKFDYRTVNNITHELRSELIKNSAHKRSVPQVELMSVDKICILSTYLVLSVIRNAINYSLLHIHVWIKFVFCRKNLWCCSCDLLLKWVRLWSESRYKSYFYLQLFFYFVCCFYSFNLPISILNVFCCSRIFTTCFMFHHWISAVVNCT